MPNLEEEGLADLGNLLRVERTCRLARVEAEHESTRILGSDDFAGGDAPVLPKTPRVFVPPCLGVASKPACCLHGEVWSLRVIFVSRLPGLGAAKWTSTKQWKPAADIRLLYAVAACFALQLPEGAVVPRSANIRVYPLAISEGVVYVWMGEDPWGEGAKEILPVPSTAERLDENKVKPLGEGGGIGCRLGIAAAVGVRGRLGAGRSHDRACDYCFLESLAFHGISSNEVILCEVNGSLAEC